MHEDLSFEDIKRQFLQRPLIPESTRRYAQDVIAFFEQGLISRELAAKYLGNIARDLEKIQAHMASLDRIETIQVGEATEVSAVDYEKLNESMKERESKWIN